MAFIRLNDNVLVDEYCDVGEGNCVKMKYSEPLRVCYNDAYKCGHWKQVFKPLWQVLQEEQNQIDKPTKMVRPADILKESEEAL